MTRTPSVRRPSARRLAPRPEALEGRKLLTAGDLDPTFGGGAGFVLTGPLVEGSKSYSPDVAYEVEVQADGAIVVAGECLSTNGGRNWGLVRMTPSGGLDPAFGTGGRVTTNFFSSHDNVGAMALQADGRIVVVGPVMGSNALDFGVARYLASGALDTSFGPSRSGKVATNISTWGRLNKDVEARRDEAFAVAIQADGKILVGGFAQTSGGTAGKDAAVVRYNGDGSLDTTFGPSRDGKVVTPVTADWDQVRSIQVRADGSILANGATWLVSYSSNGALQGITHVSPGGTRSLNMSRMTLLGDGSIVAAATLTEGTNDDIGLVRFTAGNQLDVSFGGGGIAALPDLGQDERPGRGIAVQADGKILVAGQQTTGGATPVNKTLVARFGPDGSLDATYGSGGVVIRGFGEASSVFRDAALQPDGNLVAVGVARSRVDATTSNDNFLVARLSGDGDDSSLRVASVPSTVISQRLSTSHARRALGKALADWRLRGADTSRLGHIDLVVADLGGDRLGSASGSTITLDDDAAGWGWDTGRARRATGRMDLTSALVREVGHLLGHNHGEGGVMAETLAPHAGVTRALSRPRGRGLHAPAGP